MAEGRSRGQARARGNLLLAEEGGNIKEACGADQHQQKQLGLPQGERH